MKNYYNFLNVAGGAAYGTIVHLDDFKLPSKWISFEFSLSFKVGFINTNFK